MRRSALRLAMSLLWLAYLAGGATLFFSSGRSPGIGMAYLLSALLLGWCVALMWRQDRR